jgi:hypothetical protein
LRRLSWADAALAAVVPVMLGEFVVVQFSMQMTKFYRILAFAVYRRL